jgi:uncharacterized protein YkwD
MTLAKAKPKRPTSTHRKRTAQHHSRGNHYMRTYWPYLPIAAIVTLGLVFNTWLARAQHDVLGYATDMSISSLVSGTNDQRVANGLGTLALNSMLSQAAQNKANDMVARDYWSHNTPDGQTPWTFIIATGYNYQSAGENLAYGFTSASDTITGWMNSPGHRANILNGGFQEVGFGIANSPNFVGTGPQTVVVAEYAQPVAPVAAPAPAPSPVAAAPAAVPAQTQVKQETAQPTPTETPQPEASQPAPVAELPKNATKQGDTPQQAQQSDAVTPQKVTRLQTLTATNAAWSQFAVSMLASIALLAFLLRHSFAWHKVLVRGESFIVHHPLLDILFIAVATLGFILLQTSGTIR